MHGLLAVAGFNVSLTLNCAAKKLQQHGIERGPGLAIMVSKRYRRFSSVSTAVADVPALATAVRSWCAVTPNCFVQYSTSILLVNVGAAGVLRSGLRLIIRH